MRNAAHERRIPSAESATDLPADEVPPSTADIFTDAPLSFGTEAVSDSALEAALATCSGVVGIPAAVSGFFTESEGDWAGSTETAGDASEAGFSFSDGFGFSSTAVTVFGVSATGTVFSEVAGFSSVFTVSARTGSFRTTVAVERISPSGDESVTAQAE